MGAAILVPRADGIGGRKFHTAHTASGGSVAPRSGREGYNHSRGCIIFASSRPSASACRPFFRTMNFNEMLIDLVRGREVIWNPLSKEHKNSEKVRRLWEEIASELQVDVETARTRWKTLRDRFSKERKKKPTGSGANLSGKWPLMPLMEFLLPMMTPRPTISNFQGPSLLELTGMTEEVYPDEVIIDDDSPEYTDETSTQVTPSSVLAQIRQEDSTPGSSSPQSVISTSEKCQRNKRRRTNSESVSETSDPLETAILEQLEKTATSREMTANEHFMIAFGRFANALSPSAQMVFRQCVMKGYETAVNFDASNQSGC